ncbi:hypothetical protein NKR23_g5966 [Pleurostoma richardsiae]|uniref:MYND-type domain-containing protein n=1 Tax=Pleurostoma richardsiae TaxID=41990 RepID=A0AA38RF70_9PEZI|nr:hypothetical protein NKR23_g5966 [Pleurostoma richardsiae]
MDADNSDDSDKRSRFQGLVNELIESCGHDTIVDNLCISCDEIGTSKCSGCNMANYCSPECQKKDWPVHKPMCKNWREFCKFERPSNHHYRAILLPTSQAQPVFVWLDSKQEVVHLGPVTFSLRKRGTGNIMNGAIPYRRIGHGLNMHTKVPLWERGVGEDFNQCVAAMLKPGLGRSWYGDIIIHAFQYEHREDGRTLLLHDILSQEPIDASMRDYRCAVDYFKACFRNSCVVDPESFPSTEETLPGVKIDCAGDYKRYKYFKLPAGTRPDLAADEGYMQPVIVRRKSAATRQFISAWASILGLRWVVRRDDNCMDWIENQDDVRAVHPARYEVMEFMDNPRAQFVSVFHAKLQVENKKADGTADSADDVVEKKTIITRPSDMGTVIVMHERGAQLHPLHIVAFNRFTKAMFDREKNHALSNVDARGFNAKGFEAYWKGFKRTCKLPGFEAMIADVPSPYEFENDATGPPLFREAEMTAGTGKVQDAQDDESDSSESEDEA